MDEIMHGIVTTKTFLIRTASQTVLIAQRDLDTERMKGIQFNLNLLTASEKARQAFNIF
jgi:hypothetical protein